MVMKNPDLHCWYGIVQVRITDDSFQDNRNIYFRDHEKPFYELLRTSKLETIEVRHSFWGEEATTQESLDKKVPRLSGYLDPVDISKIEKGLSRFTLDLSIGGNK